MNIEVRRVEFGGVEPLRGLYRQEMNCQIIHDSLLERGLADSYLLLADGRVAGYGAVRNAYGAGQMTEFYTLPAFRAAALPLCRELLEAGGVTGIEAQTNIPPMLQALLDCAQNFICEAVLFADAGTTFLPCPGGTLRRVGPGEAERVFPHRHEPVGEWMIEADGRAVATGGTLFHYNPPYGDLHMEVAEAERRRGYGSYLVQELKRICYETGRKPTARCSADNTASRATLQRAGFLPCGHLLVGAITP